MDEFKDNAEREKYQLAVYDKNHKLIKILKDRKSSTLKECLSKYSTKIKIVVVDMFKQFRNIIKSVLPNGVIIDKFHIIRYGVWMVRNIRIRLFNSDNKKYREYKKYWRLISQNPLKLDNIKSIEKL